MSEIRDLPVMTKADAEAIGFAGFNDVPHKVIDLPDGDFTLSAKTSDGRRVTVSFQPHSPDGAARFVDIQFHDRGTTISSADGGNMPTFNAFAITKGGRHIVDTRALTEGIKPSILVLLMDTAEEERARAAMLKNETPG